MGTLGYKYILYGYMEPLGYICGWLAKLESLFGFPQYSVPCYIKDPKRDHNFDNHPCV